MTYTKDPVTVVYIYWDNEFLDHRWLLIDPIAGMVFNICHLSSNHTNFIRHGTDTEVYIAMVVCILFR